MVKALAAIGPAAAGAIPTLERLLDDPDEDVRPEAAKALVAIGPAAAAALRRARRHPEAGVRDAVEAAERASGSG